MDVITFHKEHNHCCLPMSGAILKGDFEIRKSPYEDKQIYAMRGLSSIVYYGGFCTFCGYDLNEKKNWKQKYNDLIDLHFSSPTEEEIVQSFMDDWEEDRQKNKEILNQINEWSLKCFPKLQKYICPSCKIKLEPSLSNGLVYYCPKCKFTETINPYYNKDEKNE